MQLEFIKQWLKFERYNICETGPVVCISTSPAVSGHCYFSVHHLFLLSHFLTHRGNQNASTSQTENSLESSQFHKIFSLATCKHWPLSLPCSICIRKRSTNDDGHGWADRGSSHVSLLPLLFHGWKTILFCPDLSFETVTFATMLRHFCHSNAVKWCRMTIRLHPCQSESVRNNCLPVPVWHFTFQHRDKASSPPLAKPVPCILWQNINR